MSLPSYPFPEIFDNGVWASLSPSAKALYPAILKFANIGSGYCYPSVELLMKVSGIKTIHSYSRALKELVKAGIVKTWKKLIPGQGFKKKRVFQISMDHVKNRHLAREFHKHLAIQDDKKEQPPIYTDKNPHIEIKERNEIEPKELGVLKIGLYEIPETEMQRIEEKYGLKVLYDGQRALRKKNNIKNPTAWLWQTCNNIAFRNKEVEIEKENIIEKVKHAQELNQTLKDPQLKTLIGGMIKDGKNIPRE